MTYSTDLDMPSRLKRILCSSLMVTAASTQASDTSLQSQLQSMLDGDRTGACMAVATIDHGVKRAIACADPAAATKRKLDFDTAFEIGSISKTMTAVVAAGLMRDTELSLDTPISALLPTDTQVPDFAGQPIRLRHLLTHTSGLPALPSRMKATSLTDPYRKLTGNALLASLADVTLLQAPGESFQYSNFAMMVLSYALELHSQREFDALLSDYVFKPLNMQHSFTHDKPKGVHMAQGHSALTKPVSNWSFTPGLHGAGGVRASLNDMVRYALAHLSTVEDETTSLLRSTHTELSQVDGQRVAHNWMINRIGNTDYLAHEGGTGGFSALIALDTQRQRGIVILADTALTSLGGLSDYATALMDETAPAPQPRRELPAPTTLLTHLTGEYELTEANLRMRLWEEDGALKAQATGQGAFTLKYDSRGDFYPTSFDALLRPVETPQGLSFQWHQGGGIRMAQRVGAEPTDFTLPAEKLAEYVGIYPLMSGFSLTVAVTDDKLAIQGTGQAALTVQAVAEDEFWRGDVGAKFVFNRGPHGHVISVTLNQHGQIITGQKQ
ncbi:serine hydrolase [Arenicella chitinivorans]|nr:serine hydrolase [Arenicella chitinivorans]